MPPKPITKKTAAELERVIDRGDDDRFHCPVAGCAISCTNKWNCLAHLRTHIKDREHEFFCDLCGAGFHHSGDYSRHMKRCAGDIPACQWCGQQLGGFVKRHRLLTHERRCQAQQNATQQQPSSPMQLTTVVPVVAVQQAAPPTVASEVTPPPVAHAPVKPRTPSNSSDSSAAMTYPSPSPSPPPPEVPPEPSHRISLAFALSSPSLMPSSPPPLLSPSPLPDSPVSPIFSGQSLSQLSPHPDPYSQEPMESAERRGAVGPVEEGWGAWKLDGEESRQVEVEVATTMVDMWGVMVQGEAEAETGW
ncbi:hypothetical protein M427DRAFT_132441 [Gonapodya prolifera JEL478]|uniref:C2H2-type domain-containing protein n=1 Tax=Gonapodya prolifera (strain JEL478) TaxID=1344416 RepID=A0A139AQE4_GONPJ|nr:hypothetical protein M427DRAFT_132441 [Gonapodya prolifera JEL478]|eukprot:KXS18942.1 hypothetical protein M427DRAFT_132441 [Gonapodya prolifera JEL478]